MGGSPVHPQNPVHAATPTTGRPTGPHSQLPQNNPHPSLPQPQYHKEKRPCEGSISKLPKPTYHEAECLITSLARPQKPAPPSKRQGNTTDPRLPSLNYTTEKNIDTNIERNWRETMSSCSTSQTLANTGGLSIIFQEKAHTTRTPTNPSLSTTKYTPNHSQ